jgi:hypothetical protein
MRAMRVGPSAFLRYFAGTLPNSFILNKNLCYSLA